MSKHHTNCTKPTEVPVKYRKYGHKGKQLISKPFCDCHQCLCKNCPDVLKMFSITVTEKSCDFGSKVTNNNEEDSKRTVSEHNIEDVSNLLSIMTDDDDCNCEVAARALRSNVHRNIGLPERTTAITIKEPEVQKPSNDCNLIEKNKT